MKKNLGFLEFYFAYNIDDTILVQDAYDDTQYINIITKKE